MDKTFSSILDVSRFIAALLVFVHHAEYFLKDKPIAVFAQFGHDAVIFFFLLSGFVIGYVAENKEKTLTEYASARLARLYSVGVPAILLTWILFYVGMHYFPDKYAEYADTNWWYISLTSLFFLNQSTLINEVIPTNDPYWSINYEAWYYVIFGIYYYLGGAKKYIFLLMAALLAGPRILILFPMWLIGLYCFRKHRKLVASRATGYAMLVISLTSYLAFRAFNLDDALFVLSSKFFGGEQAINAQLSFSKRFVPDYLISALFVAMMAGIYIVREDFKTFTIKHSPSIRFFSSLTFSLYLFHYPLLVFLGELIPNSFVAILSCFLIIIILSNLTEKQKTPLAAAILKIMPKKREI